jgi:hypothetical protein
MIYGFKITILFCSSLLIFACSEAPPAEPSCRVNAQHISNHQGAAACILRMSNNMLVTQLHSGRFDVPTADTNSSNDGMLKSAQCLAHQAMWRDTGLNVEVQRVVGAQTDGTWLFACTVNAGFDGTEAPFEAPNWSKANVENVVFLNPFDIEQDNWDEPEHFTAVRDAFVLNGIYQKKP